MQPSAIWSRMLQASSSERYPRKYPQRVTFAALPRSQPSIIAGSTLPAYAWANANLASETAMSSSSIPSVWRSSAVPDPDMTSRASA